MRKTWFQHDDCTTEQADFLILQYQSRNILTKKQLNPDRLSWCVSALLEEEKKRPKSSKQWQSALGRII